MTTPIKTLYVNCIRVDLERVLDDDRLLMQIEREIDLENNKNQQCEELAHVESTMKLFENHYSEVNFYFSALQFKSINITV